MIYIYIYIDTHSNNLTPQPFNSITRPPNSIRRSNSMFDRHHGTMYSADARGARIRAPHCEFNCIVELNRIVELIIYIYSIYTEQLVREILSHTPTGSYTYI